MSRYNFRESEAKWQRIWREQRLFEVAAEPGRPKYYVLEMFPYPSGKLHVGHVRNYTMGDLVARYRRAQGFNVIHPMGWDAFGLPAENAAIAEHIHPAVRTYENIATMRAQLQRMGFAYDWSREIATCHPEYYRHEQKMFLDFLEADLAYRRESWVNWDPIENTVLANEQVIEGRGWRSGAVVEKRGARFVLSIGSGFVAASCLLFGRMQILWQLYAICFLLGAGLSAMGYLTNQMLQARIFPLQIFGPARLVVFHRLMIQKRTPTVSVTNRQVPAHDVSLSHA